MKFLIVLAFVGFAAAQQQASTNNRFQGQYVWDLLKPALTAGEVENLLASRDASYPTYAEIPQTNFACGTRNGFYADIDAQCQVFHRCDLNGNQTSYLCVNSTVFNQITLICDAWYNVDCTNSAQYETYANSRLYTDLPLFDTPPADYLTPSQRSAQQAAEVQAAGGQAGQQQVRPSRNPTQFRPAPAKINGNVPRNIASRNIAINAQQAQQDQAQIDQAPGQEF